MKKDNMKFLDTLTDTMGRSDNQALEEVISDLRENGIDVDASMKRLMDSLTEAIRRAKVKRLDYAREERLKAKENDVRLIDRFADWSKEMIIDRINEIVASNKGLMGAAYRELVNKDVDDLRSLLQDLEITLSNKSRK